MPQPVTIQFSSDNDGPKSTFGVRATVVDIDSESGIVTFATKYIGRFQATATADQRYYLRQDLKAEYETTSIVRDGEEGVFTEARLLELARVDSECDPIEAWQEWFKSNCSGWKSAEDFDRVSRADPAPEVHGDRLP